MKNAWAHGAVTVLLAISAAVPTTALAQQERCQAVAADEVDSMLDGLEVALAGGDNYEAEYLLGELRERKVRCLVDPIQPSQLARYARDRALYETLVTADQIEAVRWGRIWQRVAPDLPWPAVFPAEFFPRKRLARFLEDYGPGEPVEAPSTGWTGDKKVTVFVDGDLQDVPRAESETPHMIQVFDAKKGERLDSFQQDGAQFDPDLLGPPGAQKAPKWWIPEDLEATAEALLAEGWLPAGADPYAEWEPVEPYVLTVPGVGADAVATADPPAPKPEKAPKPPKDAKPEKAPKPDKPPKEPKPPKADKDQGTMVAGTDTPDKGEKPDKTRVPVAAKEPKKPTTEGPKKPPKQAVAGIELQRRRAKTRTGALIASGVTSVLAGAATLTVGALSDPRTRNQGFVADLSLQQAASESWASGAARAPWLYAAGSALAVGGGSLFSAGMATRTGQPAGMFRF